MGPAAALIGTRNENAAQLELTSQCRAVYQRAIAAVARITARLTGCWTTVGLCPPYHLVHIFTQILQCNLLEDQLFLHNHSLSWESEHVTGLLSKMKDTAASLGRQKNSDIANHCHSTYGGVA